MHPALAYGALVAAAALWGSNAVAARLIGADVPPVTLSWLRWLIALAVLAPFVWNDRAAIATALRRQWRIMLPLGLLANVPQSALVYQGLQTTTAMNVGLLNSTIPVLILVLAALFFSRPAAAREVAGIAASFAGVATILFQGSLDRVLALSLNRGDLLAFGAMVSWALYTLLLPRRPQLRLPVFIAAMCLVGLTASAPAVVAERLAGPPLRLQGWSPLILLYIGIGPTLAGTLAFSYGAERVGALRAGVSIHLMPVFACLFATAALGERLQPYHLAGFVLVAGGALMALGRSPLAASRPAPANS